MLTFTKDDDDFSDVVLDFDTIIELVEEFVDNEKTLQRVLNKESENDATEQLALAYLMKLKDIRLKFQPGNHSTKENVNILIDRIERIINLKNKIANYAPCEKLNLYVMGEKLLQEQGLDVFLETPKFYQNLPFEQFANLIVSSEHAVNYALKSEKIIMYLNDYENMLYQTKEFDFLTLRQTFSASCFACSLLMVLNKFGIMKEPSRLEELKIYKEIWESPGEKASIDKVIKFLNKFDINIVGIEFSDRTETFLQQANTNISHNNENTISENIINQNVNKKYETIKHQYKLFKNSVEKIKMYDLTTLNDFDFDKNSLMLMLHHAEDNKGEKDMHMLLGFNDNGKFIVIDPNQGKKQAFDSYLEYIKNEPSFMGVTFNVSQKNMK